MPKRAETESLSEAKADWATVPPSARGRPTPGHGGERIKLVRVWDAITGSLERVLRGHTGEVFAAIFHPDGTRIASAGRDRTIRLWDSATGTELAQLQGAYRLRFLAGIQPGWGNADINSRTTHSASRDTFDDSGRRELGDNAIAAARTEVLAYRITGTQQ